MESVIQKLKSGVYAAMLVSSKAAQEVGVRHPAEEIGGRYLVYGMLASVDCRLMMFSVKCKVQKAKCKTTVQKLKFGEKGEGRSKHTFYF